MLKTLRHCFILLATVCLAVACKDNNAIVSDTLGTDGIEQGKVVYDTIHGMRDPMPADKLVNPDAADTITVEEAVRIGLTLPSGGTTSQKYHVLGYVKGFNAAFDPSYGNISPIICNKLNNRQMICYRMLSFKSQKFTDESQLQVGDVIIVCGQIQNRYGAPQLTQGCYLETSDNPASGYKPGPKTVLKESFGEGFGKFVVDNKQAASEEVWQHVPAEGDVPGFMRATAKIGGTPEAAEAWLVSPVLDLTGCSDGINLSFSHYYIGADDRDGQLRVMVTTDGNNWTPLTIQDDMWNNGKQKRFITATLDITAHKSATTQIAFAYKSTAENAPTWALQNLRVGEPEEE